MYSADSGFQIAAQHWVVVAGVKSGIPTVPSLLQKLKRPGRFQVFPCIELLSKLIGASTVKKSAGDDSQGLHKANNAAGIVRQWVNK